MNRSNVSDVRVENWCGVKVRFVKLDDGEWWMLLNDLSVITNDHISYLSRKVDDDMLCRVDIDQYNVLARDLEVEDDLFDDDGWYKDGRHTYSMLAVSEIGIYKVLLENHELLEARNLRRWSSRIIQKLRRQVGLEGYKVLRILDDDVQDEIEHMLDELYFDESTGLLMQSVTVAGGDVEQVVFCEDISER